MSKTSFLFDNQSMANVMDELVGAEDGGGGDDGLSFRGSTSSWDFLGSTTLNPRDLASSSESECLARDVVESEEACRVSTARTVLGRHVTTVVPG